MHPKDDERRADDYSDVNVGEDVKAMAIGAKAQLVAYCPEHGRVTSCSSDLARIAGRAFIHNQTKHADGTPGAVLYPCD